MKNLGVIVLIALVTFHITGVIPAYVVLVHELKTEVAIELASTTSLSKISVSNADMSNSSIFQKIEEHEFRYLGKLYDFSKSEKKGTYVIFYGLEDTKEQVLNEALAVCLGNESNNPASSKLPFKSLLDNFSKDFLGHQDFVLPNMACVNSFAVAINRSFNVIENDFPPLSPPPDLV